MSFDFLIAPFAWLLRELYQFTGSYGSAIILFALVTKVLLLYFSARGKRGMMQTQRMQPKQQALAKKYEKDKAKYQQELQKLYQEEGVSMSGGCLWTLLPLPLLFALYGIIRAPLTHLAQLTQEQITKIAQFLETTFQETLPMVGANYDQLPLSNVINQHAAAVSEAFPGLRNIDYSFLGLNLGATPTLGFNWYILIPILSGATAFLTAWMSMKLNKTPGASAGQNKFMLLLSPAMSLYFAFILPAALGVYWIAQNVFTLIQEYFLTKHYNKVFEEEDARRAELEARRKAAEEAMKEELRQRRAEAIEAKKQKRKPGQTVYKVKKKPETKEETDMTQTD